MADINVSLGALAKARAANRGKKPFMGLNNNESVNVAKPVAPRDPYLEKMPTFTVGKKKPVYQVPGNLEKMPRIKYSK